jgi:DNA repair exonuclease SbcCD nuclease subunit
MTTIVHFADLHLDTLFRQGGPAIARRRRQALRDVLVAIVDLAMEVDADALFCAGDLYEHEMMAPDTGDFVRSQFERLGRVPVLVAPGNHDWLGPGSIYRQTRWSPNVKIFDSRELQPWELTDGLTVWGGAHLVPANSPGFLDHFRVDREGVNVGLFHGSLRSGLHFQEEGKQPHAPFDADQISASGLQHAFVGHFHQPADGAWHTYPGNPEPLSFGEQGDRGAVIADIADDGSVSRTRRRVARSAVHDVSVDITNCSNTQDVRDRVESRMTELTGYVRLTLEGELDHDVPIRTEDFGALAPDLDGLFVRVGDVKPAYDIEAIAEQTGTVRGRFVQDVRGANDLDDETRRRILVTGLRALDGRSDLDVT